MKRQLYRSAIFLFAGILIFFSCKKQKSCEGCIEGNKPPKAIAGADAVITLPIDSILLDGSASNDPDGTIGAWLWKKITGPASFNIANTTTPKTLVKNLVAGAYQFELVVTDDGGLSARDTIEITVQKIDNDSTQTNHAPVANAGPDETITLPLNTVTLDGSRSFDPDNNITAYGWQKIAGPSSFIIASANTVQTSVANLLEGVYRFELKVTDAGGFFSKDTVQVTVNAGPPACDHSNWPIVNATLTSIGTLSEPRIPFAAAASNKVVFAGGQKYGESCRFSCDEWYLGSSAVDIYDVTSHNWSVTQLSASRVNISVAAAGSKIFFAGGNDWNLWPGGLDASYANVDIYDAASGSWELAYLSKARQNMAVAVIGSKVFFAGGWFFTGNPPPYTDVSGVVDIYDLSTKNWSAAPISVRTGSGYPPVVLDDKVYFMGGPNSNVDIYNNTTSSWSTVDFQTVVASFSPPPGMGVIDRFSVAGDNIIFWSGSYQVGIRNITTGSTSMTCLPNPGAAVSVNNNVVFFSGNSEFAIYNPITRVWSTGVSNPRIPSNLYGPGFTVFNNTIYFGGGQYDNHCNYHNEVYSLTW